MQLEYVDVVFANRPDGNTPMEGEENELADFYWGTSWKGLNKVHISLISDHSDDSVMVTRPLGGVGAVLGVQAL